MKSKIFIILLSVLVLLFPNEVITGVKKGILISGNIIIPSLFPFTFCMIFLNKCTNLKPLPEKVTQKIFRLNSSEFSALVFSFLAGYPIGAKIISEMFVNKKISRKNAEILINYSVNSGPAFIISAVGINILGSKTIGNILLISHVISSLVLALIFGRFKEKELSNNTKTEKIDFSETFVSSVTNAASCVFSICAFLIAFSFINAIIERLSLYLSPLKYLLYITEISLGVNNTKNIYLLSFLLGFGGLCVWMQVFYQLRPIKANIGIFAISRIGHGLLSVIFTWIFNKIFKPEIQVLSNNKAFSGDIYSTVSLMICLIITAILFIISLYSKNNCGKIKEDLL